MPLHTSKNEKEDTSDENTQRCADRRYRKGRQASRRGRGKTPYHGHGLTKGVDVSVRKVAPLGDPIEVTVRGYELSLRKADAEMIEVE